VPTQVGAQPPASRGTGSSPPLLSRPPSPQHSHTKYHLDIPVSGSLKWGVPGRLNPAPSRATE
jgi:hypothetical protein